MMARSECLSLTIVFLIIFSFEKFILALALVIGIVSMILKAIEIFGKELQVIFKISKHSNELFFLNLRNDKIFLSH